MNNKSQIDYMSQDDIQQALQYDRKDYRIDELSGELIFMKKRLNAAQEEAKYWLRKYESLIAKYTSAS